MSDDLHRTFNLAHDVATNPEEYPDRFVAVSVTSAVVGRLFTPERQRLMVALKQEGPFPSVKALAQALGRDATRVGRDLKPLRDVGLVRERRVGKAKQVEATGLPIIMQ